MSLLDPAVLLRRLVLPTLLAGGGVMAIACYFRHPWRPRLIVVFRLATILGLAVLVVAPSLSWESVTRSTPEIHVALDLSQSMTLDDGTSEDRLARATRIVKGIDSTYGSTGSAFTVRLFGFGSSVRPLNRDEPWAAADPFTDITGALKASTSAGENDRVRALFLVTDGRSSSTERSQMWAKTSEIPIYTIGVGRESYGYRDDSIEQVSTPDHAFKQSLVKLEVSIRTRGGVSKPERLSVTLRRLGSGGDEDPDTVIDKRPVDLVDGEGRVSFEFKPDASGLVRYEVSIPDVEGELTHFNNRRILALMVEDEPRTVALVAGKPSWDGAFIQRVIRTDPRFRLEPFVVTGLESTHRFKEEDFKNVSLIILESFRARDFSPEQITALISFVKKGQGNLWVTGVEPEHADELIESRLGEILPVGKQSGTPAGVRLHVLLSPLGLRHPIMQVSRHSQANRLAWKNLPPVAPSGMFTVGSAERQDGHVLGTFSRYPNDLAAIAYRFAGSGLVFFTNTYEMHLLKLLPAAARDEEQAYEKFVAQALDWMTDRASVLGVTLNLGKPRYVQGESINVEVSDYLGNLPGDELSMDVIPIPGKGQIHKIRLVREEHVFMGRFALQEPGVYEVSLPVGDAEPIKRHIFVDPETQELGQPFADFTVLRDLASFSNGGFFGEKDEDYKRLPIDAKPLIKVNSTNLYWVDQGRFLLVILILLCLEWVIRRRSNLV